MLVLALKIIALRGHGIYLLLILRSLMFQRVFLLGFALSVVDLGPAYLDAALEPLILFLQVLLRLRHGCSAGVTAVSVSVSVSVAAVVAAAMAPELGWRSYPSRFYA